MVDPEKQADDVEAGVEAVEEAKLTPTAIEVKLDEKHMYNLAMLSGIMRRSPSRIVCDLLDAAFPDHLLKKWREEHSDAIRRLEPVVKWEEPPR